MDPDALKKSLITVSIEGMRFARTATRAISKLEAHEQTKYIGAIKFRGFKFQVQQLVMSWSDRISHRVS